MRKTFDFALSLLFSPSKAVRRLQSEDGALLESVNIYLLFSVASVAFYAWKPASFPPADPDSPLFGLTPQSQSILFWTKVQLWEPVFSGIWIVFLAAFSGFFRASFASLPLQIALGGLMGLVPAIPMILYRKGVIPALVLVLFWALLIGTFYPYLRRRVGRQWKSLASLALAINVVDAALLAPACISVILELPAAYNALHYILLVWTLGLGSYLLAKLEGLSTARAFTVLVLSFMWQLLFVLSLYALGLFHMDMLSGMMSV